VNVRTGSLLVALGVFVAAGAARAAASPARSYVLVDMNRRIIVSALRPDLALAPASLAKIMTACVVLDAVDRGAVSLDSRAAVPAAAWSDRQPAGSSVMGLGSGQTASVDELLKGLLVVSGNDAAVALALRVSGSMGAFVDRMNGMAARMELKATRFEDPAGLSPLSRTTAREYASLVGSYITRWPWTLARYHAVATLLYPTPGNLPRGAEPLGRVLYNKNNLLGRYRGCDGLKTGHLEEVGYNIAATAQRSGVRFLAVVLGIQAVSDEEGCRLREEEARRLLDLGFARARRITAPPGRRRPSRRPAPPRPSWPGRLP
jgi:serine-type D-Ala-D-Ala carboxypeptidase (penicillin-binding protein 5/6)